MMPSIGTNLTGFVLAIVGALLDFASAYLILSGSVTMVQNGMGMNSVQVMSDSAIIWGVGIFVFGVVLIITAYLSISNYGRIRMRTVGGLMLAYGVIMFLIGGSMFSGITPMMQGSVLSSIGMFIVGVLMIMNGILMQKTEMAKE